QPIKSYSSGMKSRLGFAIAIHTDPDVLIVDEALSVGDETFSNKCIEKMKQFQNDGKTIFFISHSASQVSKMCNKALWIHYGETKEYGDCEPIVKNYSQFIDKFNEMTKEEQLQFKDKMIKQQQKKGLENKNDNSYHRSLLRYLPGAALLGLFI